jgi:hypothetical protein
MTTRMTAPHLACMLALCVAACAAAAADAPAVVTLLEGQAALFRGTAKYALAEGVRIAPGDMIEVADKSLCELEFADGGALSLGAGGRFHAPAIAAKGAKGPGSDYYLMRGWSKFTSPSGASPYRYTTPVFGLAIGAATGVLQVGDGEAALFVESGEVRIAEGFAKATPSSPALKSGEFYQRKSDQKPSIQPRPSQAFVASMPRSFMDNLPSRLAKWKDRDVAPRKLDEASYADVEFWLKAPVEIRKPLVQRFTPRVADPAFRAALVANLKQHPEWDPVLFPEKYRPKPPPEDAGKAAAAPAARPDSSANGRSK